MDNLFMNERINNLLIGWNSCNLLKFSVIDNLFRGGFPIMYDAAQKGGGIQMFKCTNFADKQTHQVQSLKMRDSRVRSHSLAGLYYQSSCLSVQFVGVASPPVQCKRPV